MDDLSQLRARLTEMIEAKIARRAALQAELVSLDAELVEAQLMLGSWKRFPKRMRKRQERQERRANMDRKLKFEDVSAFLQSTGPQGSQRILDFFGITDGRCGTALYMWAKAGRLLKHNDGRFAAAVP